ncbi:MAG: hypothetical protein U1F55_01885 [Chitinivorax sp.]
MQHAPLTWQSEKDVMAAANSKSIIQKSIATIVLTTLALQLSGCGFLAQTRFRTTEKPAYSSLPKSKKALAESSLGKPNEILPQDDGAEIWRYYGESRWAGLFLWVVIVPVPLLVPIGVDKKDYRIVGDEVKEVTYHSMSNCSLGILLVPPVSDLGLIAPIAKCGRQPYDAPSPLPFTDIKPRPEGGHFPNGLGAP